MLHEFLNKIEHLENLEPTISADEYSPLVLAYLGDAVLELYVRTMLVAKGNIPVHKLHIQASKFVSAKAQSEMVEKVLAFLSEDEIKIFKRGRNAKSYSSPKNMSIMDYRRSTGLESLLGYLYLKHDNERIYFILEKCIKEPELE